MGLKLKFGDDWTRFIEEKKEEKKEPKESEEGGVAFVWHSVAELLLKRYVHICPIDGAKGLECHNPPIGV